MALLTAEVTWLRWLLADGVDAFYTRAQVQAQVIALQYVHSELQLADFFTNAQTRVQHDFLLSKLSVVDPP
jgi:hypothetical protein